MPSSSWRLIRPDGTGTPDAPQGQAPITPAASSPAAPARHSSHPAGAAGSGEAANVLRGRGHTSNRAVGPAAAPLANAGSQLVPGATDMDQTELAEQIRRIERTAEERGYETGRRRAESELRAAVEGASAMADRLAQMAPDRTSEIAHAIAELALTVAKRIVQHEVRIEPSLLCSSLEAAVSTINGSPEAHVLLNPAAVEPVREAWEALHGRAYLGKKWFFEGDPTLPDGGCTLRYDHGFVEAGLESQLEEIGIALDRAIPGLSRNEADEDVA
jgi:flagellar biosynthesis/type III secretory pathway protein FliH